MKNVERKTAADYNNPEFELEENYQLRKEEEMVNLIATILVETSFNQAHEKSNSLSKIQP